MTLDDFILHKCVQVEKQGEEGVKEEVAVAKEEKEVEEEEEEDDIRVVGGRQQMYVTAV